MLQFNSLTRLSRALVPRAANTLRRAKSTTTSNLSYSERMDKTGRPISPHVIPSWAPMAGVPQETRGFVYALPAIAWSSLTMRFTGMALWGGAVGFGALAVIDPSAPASMASSIAGSAVAFPAKFTVAFASVYHLFGACRHLYWDKTAQGFSNPAMRQSSYALLAASTVVSLALATTSWPQKAEPKKK